MTKKIDTSHEAKQRMREYLKNRGITMTEAETACGFKRGYLTAGGVVGSDKLAAFVTAYPDCDIYYIITGRRHDDARLQRVLQLAADGMEACSQNRKILKAINNLVTNMVT